MKKKLICIIVVITITLSIFTSCDLFHQHMWMDATCTSPQRCDKCPATEGEALGHNFVYGMCSRCSTIDDTTQENLKSVVKSVAAAYWILGLNISLHVDNFDVEFTKIENDNDRYITAGHVFVNYEDERYVGKFTLNHVWSEETESFVRESSNFGDFYQANEDGNIQTLNFTSYTTFSNYKNGSRVGIWVFKDTENCTQYIYSFAGDLIYTGECTYYIYKTPKNYELHLIPKSNGKEMIMYGTDNYIATSDGNDVYYMD